MLDLGLVRVFHGCRLGRHRVRGEPPGMLFSPKAYRHGQKALDRCHPFILR